MGSQSLGSNVHGDMQLPHFHTSSPLCFLLCWTILEEQSAIAFTYCLKIKLFRSVMYSLSVQHLKIVMNY